MRPALLTVLTLMPLLAACGEGSMGGVKSAATRPPPVANKVVVRVPQRHPVPPSAHVQLVPGLEGVIGATAPDLARQFGAARLDVWEGDARKLQFAGTACVLDVYLYPSAAGREPQATYVDARRQSDGKDVDRVACVSALRKR